MNKQILSISQLPRRKRFVIELDDGTSFMLSGRDLSGLKLTEGTPFGDDEYADVLEIMIPKAREKIISLLARSDRSENELRNALSREGYLPEAVDSAIAYAKSYDYIDDRRLTDNYILLHQHDRSKKRIISDLLKKQIREDIIEAELEKIYEADPVEEVKKLLEKKQFDFSSDDYNAMIKEKARAYRFLLSRGYDYTDIAEAISAWQKSGNRDN